MAGIPPAAWDAAAEVSDPAQDLRLWRLWVERVRGNGRPALRLQLGPRADNPPDRPAALPTLKEMLLMVWHLPADNPDFLLDVYVNLYLRQFPDLEAPVLRSSEIMS